jgi:hypothetical protein
MAPDVATLLAGELGKDQAWIDAETQSFWNLATQYTLPNAETHSVRRRK